MGAGGKRAGAGRPKGSRAISAELRQAAQEHTQDAINVLVEVMQTPDHPQRLKAAELVLARGHGTPREEPASVEIINQFMSGELSAIAACLMLEAEGLKVPDTLQRYFDNEISIATHTDDRDISLAMFDAPKPLPLR